MLHVRYIKWDIHPFTFTLSHMNGRISWYDLGINNNKHSLAFRIWLKDTQWSLRRKRTESLTHPLSNKEECVKTTERFQVDALLLY